MNARGCVWTHRIIHWTARSLAALVVGTFALFAFGEGVPNPADMDPAMLTQLLCNVIALAGLVVLWFRERLGGLVAVAGMAGFYLVNYLSSGRWPSGSVFPLFFVAGGLAVLASLLPRGDCRPDAPLTGRCAA